MKFDALQILGMLLLVLGVQGTIRQLVDHSDTGLLDGLPGGFTAALALHLVAAALGAVLAGWAHGRAKAHGRRS